MTLPDGQRGQALAVGITVLASVLLWLAVGGPLMDFYADGQAELAQRRTLAAHMAELAASLPALRRAAEARPGSQAEPVTTLQGATDAVAGAALQERVQALASGAGISLASLETLPAEQRGPYRRIGLRISAVSLWPGLVALLQAIEQATPAMVLDDVELRGPMIANRPADTPLRATFTLYAFRAES